MKTAIVFLAILALAAASCPNQCSGHGRCGDNDKCACYTQSNTPWGQRSGWTGADCSLRTCPLGIAFDAVSNSDDRLGAISYVGDDDGRARDLFVELNNDYELNRDVVIYVRVSSVSPLEVQWRFGEDEFFQQPITMPNADVTGLGKDQRDKAYEIKDHLNGDKRTGIVFYFDETATGYISPDSATGSQNHDEWVFTVSHNNMISFRSANDNTLHQMEQCSGRGSCDETSGRCQCFTGYSGEACQRTTCPNDCSGHGVCQEERRFVADAADAESAGYTYDVSAEGLGPFDARKQMGCSCDAGFRGPDCSMIECPSGLDPLRLDADTSGRDCSGRGVCDYSSGECACFKGFFGERCETQTNFL